MPSKKVIYAKNMKPSPELKENNRHMRVVAIIHHLAVSCWFGGAALFTFVLTPALFAAYSRDIAGNIVGLLFPGYFQWGLACGVVALISLLLPRGPKRRLPMLLIGCMLAVTAVQAFVIEPKAAVLKQEIPSFATTSPDHPLRRQFRRLHGVSAAANLAVILGGAVLVCLSANGGRRKDDLPPI